MDVKALEMVLGLVSYGMYELTVADVLKNTWKNKWPKSYKWCLWWWRL